ncbi:MAG: hypothetical protein ACREVN_07780 [Gammaproteobacteria bacterium]
MNTRILLALGLLALGGAAQADVLLLDGIDAAHATDSARPARGVSMDRVEARFGAPVSRGSAVGDPPITRWEYADFVVYFEYDHVIHAVAKHPGKA